MGAASLLLSLGCEGETKVLHSRLLRCDEALLEASKEGNVEMCSALLSHGSVDVDIELDGETALLCAASAGKRETLAVLLLAQADPNHCDASFQETPLIRAV